MKILGVDPGYDRLGLAVIESAVAKPERVIFSTCLNTSRRLLFEDRLWQLMNRLEAVLKKYRPDILALEKIFFTRNQKTALAVAEVRGAVTYLARKQCLPIINLTPLEIKSAITGYGRADKEQIKFMVVKLLGIKRVLKSDDEADSLAVALAGLRRVENQSLNNCGYPQSGRGSVAKKPRYAKK